MKLNWTGVALCLFYAVTTVACLMLAFSGNDPKGDFVLKQIPIAWQLAIAAAMGLGPWLEHLSWFWAYAIFFPLTCAFLYGIGWVLSRGVKRN